MANNETAESIRLPAYLTSEPRKTLRWRIISSVVLIGLALGSLAFKPWAMVIFALALGAAMALEWGRLTARRPILLAAGLAWVAFAGTAVVALRLEPGGAAIMLWLFAIAWAGDIAAFAVGHAAGRRRLPAWISAEKTWEGLAGGAFVGALAGSLAGHFAAPFGLSGTALALASAALAVAGQLGDCLESAAKRRLGVKDMSGLIPGHGGVLDRLDSMLAILFAAGGALVVARWLW